MLTMKHKHENMKPRHENINGNNGFKFTSKRTCSTNY